MDDKAAETKAETCQAYCPLCRAFQVAHEVKGNLKRCLPAEFWEHSTTARREGLLALRSLIDSALAHEPAGPARKATRIKVE